MYSLCEICLETQSTIICKCTNVQCLECILKNNSLCCFCSTEIPVLRSLLNKYNKEHINKIITYYSVKLYTFITENFELNFVLNSLLRDLLRYKTHIEETYAIKQYNNLLSKKIYLKQVDNYSATILLDMVPKQYRIPIDIVKSETTNNTSHIKIIKYSMFYIDYTIKYYHKKDNKISDSYQINNKFISKINTQVKKDEINYFYKETCINFYNALTQLLSFNQETSEIQCYCNRLDCQKCNILYCKFCLEKTNISGHKCSQEQTIEYNNIKLCPNCKTLVEKLSGCDDMYCLNCKIFFSWDFGTIFKGILHNPDHIKDSIKNVGIKTMFYEDVFSGIFIPEQDIFFILLLDINKFRINILKRQIRQVVIPLIFKIFFCLEILDTDTLNNRDFTVYKKLSNICKTYKKTLEKVCGKFTYKFGWDEIQLKYMYIKASENRILYTLPC